MPLDDHVLLLQLERANEALTDRIEAVEEDGKDDSHYYDCDCDCADVTMSDVDAVSDRVATLDDAVTGLRTDLRECVDIVTDLTVRMAVLEEKFSTLLDALRGGRA